MKLNDNEREIIPTPIFWFFLTIKDRIFSTWELGERLIYCSIDNLTALRNIFGSGALSGLILVQGSWKISFWNVFPTSNPFGGL